LGQVSDYYFICTQGRYVDDRTFRQPNAESLLPFLYVNFVPSQLDAIIRTYTSRIRPKAQVELDWFARQPSLQATIEKAGLAKNSRDKRYSHQRRLKSVALEQALGVLSEQAGAIGKVRSFDHLFALDSASFTSMTHA
jgi:hypothetical protein